MGAKRGGVRAAYLRGGDNDFFRLLGEDADFFSLKMFYEGDRLVEAVLDGRDLLEAEAAESVETV